MSRLTNDDGICVDCEGIDVCSKNCIQKQVYDKLKKYEDLEEQGRLIELPCKVGDTVYASIDFDNKIFDGKVKSLEYDEVKKCWLAEILFQNDFVMKK